MNYEEDDYITEAEQDNFYNLQEELRRQIDAVIEENAQLRKGNLDLLEALAELRQRKEELLEVYGTNIEMAEQLASELNSRKRRQSYETVVETHVYTPYVCRSSSYSPSPHLYPYPYPYPSSSSSTISYSSYPHSRLYRQALDYARYSSPTLSRCTRRANNGRSHHSHSGNYPYN